MASNFLNERDNEGMNQVLAVERKGQFQEFKLTLKFRAVTVPTPPFPVHPVVLPPSSDKLPARPFLFPLRMPPSI